ncbi:MAG: 30S ribosomal protein S17 [Mycoplasmataceae bacterium]|jgi:small subunit ribosomal protein S17|nr:30S ribosomal protein S17 [Mycoplasmataceae bacterium]
MENRATQSRKTFSGIVVSTKMQKTIVVKVERKTTHPRFKKLVISHKKYHVHDEKNEAQVGDKVVIIETRPLSKTKFYRLVKIVEKAK